MQCQRYTRNPSPPPPLLPPIHVYLALEERVVAGVAAIASFPFGGRQAVLGVKPEVEAAGLEPLRVLLVHPIRLLVHLQQYSTQSHIQPKHPHPQEPLRVLLVHLQIRRLKGSTSFLVLESSVPLIICKYNKFNLNAL